MNKFLSTTLLLILWLHQGVAQTDAYRNAINPVFDNLNISQITTGLLWDYGVNLVDPLTYSGTLNSNNKVTHGDWGLLYSTLVTQNITGSGTMTDPITITNSIKSYNASDANKINITSLFYEFDKIKSTAISANQLYISNDKLYDVFRRIGSPYETKTTFAAAPTINVVSGNSQTFKLRSALYYSNSSKVLSTRQVDLDDGQGYRTFAWDGEATANYTTEGEKTVKVKFSYTDGTTLYSHFKILVKDVVVIEHLPSPPPISSAGAQYSIPFPQTGYTPLSYSGGTSSALLTIDLADNHTTIQKPLIIVEGFDPQNSFSFFDLFDNAPGGFGILIGSSTLLTEIFSKDYDIIFVDLDDNMTFIQRNAYLLQEVIQWVNDNKTGSEDNVVLGMSMGGLIARYALADMEDRNVDHETRLFISHDTPHQGANVPIGIQAAFRHLIRTEFKVGIAGYTPIIIRLRDIADFDIGLSIIDSEAAKQMLKYYVNPYVGSLSVGSSYHNTFMQDLKSQGLSGSNGYPSRWGIRNVAIANGSECGDDIGFNAGAQLMSFNDEDLPNLLKVLRNFISINKTGRFISLTAGLTTSKELKVDFSANALPSNQVAQVYSGSIKIKKLILFLISQTTTITSASLNSLSTMLPLDNAAGGIYSLPARSA